MKLELFIFVNAQRKAQTTTTAHPNTDTTTMLYYIQWRNQNLKISWSK